MNRSTIMLHRNLIRAIKAMLAAWERWLAEQEKETPEKSA